MKLLKKLLLKNSLSRLIEKYPAFTFFLILIFVSYLYNYDRILFFKAQSIHHWRQADCLSFAKNYFENGLDFFSPQIHYQIGTGEGRTVSEFPIIYYFVAILWKIFGQYEFIFRLVNLTFTFIGLMSLFKIFESVLKDFFWATMLTLLIFSSPIYVYYSNNFLADTPAFNLSLVGWYFFYRFYVNKRIKLFYVSMAFFLLAGLIKITSSISFFSICFAFFLELIHLKKFGLNNDRLFSNKLILPIVIVILVLMGWLLNTKHYNNFYSSNGPFLIGILPIWELSASDISDILQSFKNKILSSFLNYNLLIFIIGLFIITIIFIRKSFALLTTFLLFSFLCVVSYLILFYQVFTVHDYYMTNLLIFIVFIEISFFTFFKKNYRNIFNNKLVKICFALLISFNIYITTIKIKAKYFIAEMNKSSYELILNQEDINYYSWTKKDYDARFAALEELTPFLRRFGIQRNDKVISLPDQSLNITLYLMDQKGWTNWGNWTDEEINYSMMSSFINRGAKYLIINDARIIDKTVLKPYLKNLLFNYKNIKVYKLNY